MIAPGIIRVIWQSLRNDPFDLCFEQSSEVLGQRAAVARPRPTASQTLGQLFGVVRLALQALRQPTVESAIEGRVFFIATSDNHVHAVQPVLDRLAERAVLGDGVFNGWLRRRAALYALPFLPVLLLRCVAASRYERTTVPVSIGTYWLSYGLFITGCVLLRRRPALVVLGSDHGARPRIIGFAARFMGIPTAFIPHAGVTKGLPPLAFEFAFLDGLHMARAYARCGPSRTVRFLAGVPRLDAVMHRPRREGRRLAVCPALRDDVETVLELLGQAVAALSSGAVTIRPHPREPALERYIQAARALGCIFSDAQRESAGAFLKSVDVVVCGDSNLLAEAKVAHRWVVFFDPRESMGDQYGYVADGVPHATCRNGADLVAFLSNPATKSPPPTDRLDSLMATIGTPWEGRSADLIAATLIDLAGGAPPPGSLAWERSDDPVAGAVFLPPRL